MDIDNRNRVLVANERFIQWLEKYGEKSYDQYDFWASEFGQKAKALYYSKKYAGTLAVAPLVLMDAFTPAMRKLFIKKSRFPIADAHYSMGFSYLYSLTGDERYIKRARHFLDVLENTRCAGYEHFCWGYPFSWSTVNGVFKKGTPLITTTPYVYEAFVLFQEISGEKTIDEALHSIAEHALHDIKDSVISDGVAACSYSPFDRRRVVNANAYRAFLLIHASKKFNSDEYRIAGEQNLRFVLQSQQADGSWYYAMDGKDKFIDHFHTCFVLKNIKKIEHLTGLRECTKAIEKGSDFYLKNLLDEKCCQSHLPLLHEPYFINVNYMIMRRALTSEFSWKRTIQNSA